MLRGIVDLYDLDVGDTVHRSEFHNLPHNAILFKALPGRYVGVCITCHATDGDYFLEPATQWGAEPPRHHRWDLHLRQMRSPAHSLVNGRRQERQLRTLGSCSRSGSGFSLL